MAEEEVDGKGQPSPSQLPFLEVLCKSCGKVRRFASGTEAGFAVCLINSKLSFEAPPALYIEAAKDGEESICFGPKAALFNYGEGWKLQTVIEEAMKEGYEAAASQKIPKQISSMMVLYWEASCWNRSHNRISIFCEDTDCFCFNVRARRSSGCLSGKSSMVDTACKLFLDAILFVFWVLQ
ncbi:uncharacterized protein LOC110033985 isoform X1 [Phalaenopsis equestris]|uniref:uncharacterized protein LOC110033985 isoform X1 n=1 Tax=Phalaenopsis equestris TaxID=78828 RepID=UPI0009E2CA18|nr:uncharacterized protein LOC110033985 isoform X1 [Phalaenopsis equestris]